ncbi:hypothetical protein FH608_012470 [Nonomuraea phyllanthi]|uniref:Uncharacterized protein n=1 Tax=Nonomuraea phyllanthi TaxID=2219224 RepID=A0A5C4WPC3_9ACTN|nr:hypothetical protein [Nonomuraea phyllanthi]KAB8195186.1 hypothetical protein FH608_012470 [Nonomuraea phyllanthi]QFY10682.1 hypothetical protein GBF35_32360 [Nonomuraea phyllanthi]
MLSRTAVSAGVLAVALAAVPVAAPAAAAASQDCTRGGGVLSGVTNTLCDVVNTLTGTIDTVTGGTTDKVTDGLDKTTDEVLGRVGEVVPTTKASPSTKPPRSSSTPSTPSPADPSPSALQKTLDNVCLPVLSCRDRGDDAESVSPTPTPTPSPGRTSRLREWGVETFPTTAAPTPPPHRPQSMDNDRPVTKENTVDTDEPRVDLLWPNPFQHELTVPMQEQRVVRPTPPASDVLGTVLTIALLGSAVLATRIVQQRRQRAEPAESIPFEPGRAANGRHRLA